VNGSRTSILISVVVLLGFGVLVFTLSASRWEHLARERDAHNAKLVERERQVQALRERQVARVRAAMEGADYEAALVVLWNLADESVSLDDMTAAHTFAEAMKAVQEHRP
jgi:hypothetical protein